MPLIATRGAASVQGFGEFAQQTAVNYIEDVFSTYLYTGNGTTQTITNGIDLSTKGGLVWIKMRATAGYEHVLTDTVRGNTKWLSSDNTLAQQTAANTVTSFNTTGFSIGDRGNVNRSVAGENTFASWTFREQPKFFDIVTYTGDKASGRSIAHNLGSTPGCIIIKSFSDTEGWTVYHRSLTAVGYYLNLSATSAESNLANGISSVTDSSFTIGSNDRINSTGQTFVAYIFAHNAGGFGLTGTDNVISCGSVTLDGSGNATVNLGYEPQWVMIKRSDNTSDWYMHDNMRGLDLTTYTRLYANTSGAELTSTPTYIAPSSTGFNLINGFSSASSTWIYIAIRRGPMKVPTLGTSVYKSSLLAGNSSTQQITDLDFPPDLVMTKARNTSYGNRWTDRLRGFGYALRSDDVGAELNNTTIGVNPFNMNGYTVLSGNPYNQSGFNYVNHAMRRAPSFFDEVCYTGTGSATTVSHNLAAVPELMIVKWRTGATGEDWYVYAGSQGNTKYLSLNLTASIVSGSSLWNSTTPTSSVFSLGSSASVNGSGYTYVAYLFATCAGVSKVGSYTGNGTTQTINCGFGAGGARFVLIKRTDSTGDWYVYDTVRGMTTSTDPYLLFNTTDPEVATLGSVTTVSTGFALNSTILAAINVNAGTYIFLAIA